LHGRKSPSSKGREGANPTDSLRCIACSGCLFPRREAIGGPRAKHSVPLSHPSAGLCTLPSARCLFLCKVRTLTAPVTRGRKTSRGLPAFTAPPSRCRCGLGSSRCGSTRVGTHPFCFPHVLRSMGGLRYFPCGQNLTPCSVACSGRQMCGCSFSDSEGQSMHCSQRGRSYEVLAFCCSDKQPKMTLI
jgi:hypothetical protein